MDSDKQAWLLAFVTVLGFQYHPRNLDVRSSDLEEVRRARRVADLALDEFRSRFGYKEV